MNVAKIFANIEQRKQMCSFIGIEVVSSCRLEKRSGSFILFFDEESRGEMPQATTLQTELQNLTIVMCMTKSSDASDMGKNRVATLQFKLKNLQILVFFQNYKFRIVVINDVVARINQREHKKSHQS